MSVIRYLARRNFNVIDGFALSLMGVSLAWERPLIAGGCVFVGLIVSSAIEWLAERGAAQ